LHAGHIDRRLADGTVPWHTPVYAARCRQLAAPHSRRVLARSLERLVEDADAGPRAPLSAAIAPSRARVQEARPELLILAAELRSDRPVEPRGLAAIRVLLSDGSSPVYTRGDPEALKLRLETVASWLEVDD
jgi:hypothetical protein